VAAQSFLVVPHDAAEGVALFVAVHVGTGSICARMPPGEDPTEHGAARKPDVTAALVEAPIEPERRLALRVAGGASAALARGRCDQVLVDQGLAAFVPCRTGIAGGHEDAHVGRRLHACGVGPARRIGAIDQPRRPRCLVVLAVEARRDEHPAIGGVAVGIGAVRIRRVI
jgi:hypothetical protein